MGLKNTDVSYACLSRLANWLWNSLNTSAVVQLHILAEVISTLSAKKVSDVCGWWIFLLLYTYILKFTCVCDIIKLLRSTCSYRMLLVILLQLIRSFSIFPNNWKHTQECAYVSESSKIIKLMFNFNVELFSFLWKCSFPYLAYSVRANVVLSM